MFELPPLEYSFDALEPFIDSKTMELHHDKHHATYVNKLNEALSKYPELQSKSLEDLLGDISSLPDDIKQAVINHGGGHFNHSFFWKILNKDGSKEPVGRVKLEMIKVYGDFANFKTEFTKQATSLFGSGWTWLSASSDGVDFSITNFANQETPVIKGRKPILGLDVWEHAYYLNYQNRRPEYIEAFWNIIDWDKVEMLFEEGL
jgi:Fe-Mn family superoxide dismutase